MPEQIETNRAKTNVLATMAKNSLANLFRTGMAWIVVFFLPPLLVRVMDKPAYGVWLLLLQMAAYITMVDGGIQIAIARYVARGDRSQDPSYLGRFLSSAGMFLIITSLLSIVLISSVSWFLTDLFRDIPLSIAQNARQALLIVGISLALSLPFSVLAGFFLGRQRYEIAAFASSIGRFAGALGTAWAAYHHQGMVVMAIWVAMGNMIQALIYVAFWRRAGTGRLLHPSLVEKDLAREFVVFCSAMLVSQFSVILITGLDMPIVAIFDFKSAAYYGLAAVLSNALIVPHSAITNSLLPVAAGISAANDPERLGQVLLKSTRFATAMLCLITMPLLLLMPLFLRLWVGSDYASHTLLLGETLVVAQFVRLTMFPYAMIGFAAGQQDRMLVSAVVEGAVNLVCSLALVRVMGAWGVALGTLVGASVGVWIHLTVSLRRTDRIKVNRSDFVRIGILKPFLIGLPFMSCAFVSLWVSSPIVHLFVVLLAELALFALFWNFTFDLRERRQILGLFQHFAAICRRTPRALNP